MKWIEVEPVRALGPSLPARGAWIEIFLDSDVADGLGSLPARGAWIEINTHQVHPTATPSLPARGAWIEIENRRRCEEVEIVAPREGSVD